jgi:hypothetical protein
MVRACVTPSKEVIRNQLSMHRYVSNGITILNRLAGVRVFSDFYVDFPILMDDIGFG